MTSYLFLAAYTGLLALAWPLVTWAHELGHALVGRLLSGHAVDVFIGSYGNTTRCLRLPLGRGFRLYVSWNPVRWRGGMCQFAEPLHGWRAYLMVLAGPVVPVLLASGLVWWFFRVDSHDVLRLCSLAMLVVAVPSMCWNLCNYPNACRLDDGTCVDNDGAKLRKLWRNLHLPETYVQGLRAYTQGNYGEAASLLGQHLNLKHNQNDNIRMALSALVTTGQYEEAHRVLNEYVAKYEPDAYDLCIQASIRLHFHDIRTAIDCYSQALAQDPDCELALNNRGYAHLRLECYAESIADFRRALELNPAFAYAHANLGLALLMLGQPTEGLEHVRHSLELDDTNAYAYRNLGIYHLQRNELAAAQEQFDRAWALDPTTDLLADYRTQLHALQSPPAESPPDVPCFPTPHQPC